MERRELMRLEDVPNIGPAIAAKLHQIGVHTPSDLIGRDPYAMFDELDARTGTRHDPCLLDVFIAATQFMGGEAARPWWAYTQERKASLAQFDRSRSAGAREGHDFERRRVAPHAKG
jgi:hypothetical protein